MRNLITDVAGLRVGNATDMALASGVTALLFDGPAVASIAIGGGAPGTRDTSLLEPGMTVETVDALVLSGGSAFGLDAMGGVQAFLREQGRGFPVRDIRVPIVPGAILFDLLNGGDKAWGRHSPYRDLGYEAAVAAGLDFDLGSCGAGTGATTVDVKGGLGSASAATPAGFTVGALVAVNAIGSGLVGPGPHFWAAPYERDGEFGGRGWPASMPDLSNAAVKGTAPENTTIAIVATDAALTRAQAKRMAMMAQDGMGRALRPAHAAFDGDLVMSAATGARMVAPEPGDLVDIGVAAADCLARAIARALYEARALPFAGALPAWRDLFG
ncbi:MAG: P1 family peptidase [Beijerinckiaceae bacterium]|jgi:L-aminopeptidase/D-esterase-like protein|nr:P1 family peptidase [Beijerinckiaceae bacterium]MDO9441385.1 P1 family peptidase [Beijerinckiaceae bacterium]